MEIAVGVGLGVFLLGALVDEMERESVKTFLGVLVKFFARQVLKEGFA
jgi:hypothetical protein